MIKNFFSNFIFINFIWLVLDKVIFAITSFIILVNISNSKSLISGYIPTINPFKAFTYLGSSENIKPVYSLSAPFSSRQSLSKFFFPNGEIYIFDINKFILTKSFYLKPCISFVMDQVSSIDINDQKDLIFAKEMLRKKL